MDDGQRTSGVFASPASREAVDYNDPHNCPYEIDDDLQTRIDKDFTYHSPKGDQVDRYPHLRNKGQDLAETICRLVPDSRERAKALTKLKEVIMWANAGIACNE